MKLVRFGDPGSERPGMIDGAGRLRDLSGAIDDITPACLDDASLDRLRRLDASTLPLATGSLRMGPPVAGTGKFIGIGLNYVDHAAESGLPLPEEPTIFMKPTSCIQGPDDDVMIPKGSLKTDWEVELGIVIGIRAQHVAEQDALAHVAGYCTVNDVSERAFQHERGGSWDKGKGCDTFGPIGPWLVTRDEVPDPQALDLWLEVNGKRMQQGNTRNMIFSVRTLVSYVSSFMTLMPGDVIATGTPHGVGAGMKPPVFLNRGDMVRLAVAGLGEQSQKVVAFSASKQ